MIYLPKRSREAKARKAEVKKAVEELDSIRCQLGESYVKFNNVTDPSALDTCIYEISALKAKYNYAVRNLKSYFL